MKPKVLLFGIFTISLFAFGVLITTLFNSAPIATENIIMFYSSLFLSLLGIIFFINYLLVSNKTKTEPSLSTVWSILKLAVITDLLLILLIFLKSKEVLNTATAVTLTVIALIIALVTRKRWIG